MRWNMFAVVVSRSSNALKKDEDKKEQITKTLGLQWRRRIPGSNPFQKVKEEKGSFCRKDTKQR